MKYLTAANLVLTGLMRLTKSANGSQRFRVEFTNDLRCSFELITRSDAAFCYDLDASKLGKVFDIVYHVTKGGNSVLDSMYGYQEQLSKDLLIDGFANTAKINRVVLDSIKEGYCPSYLNMIMGDVFDPINAAIRVLAARYGLLPIDVFGWLKTHHVAQRDFAQVRRHFAAMRAKTRTRNNGLMKLDLY